MGLHSAIDFDTSAEVDYLSSTVGFYCHIFGTFVITGTTSAPLMIGNEANALPFEQLPQPASSARVKHSHAVISAS